MNKRKTKAKPKRGASADAPASEGEGARARKEAFDLADADTIHDLMELNGPRVARWALQCVQKVARGRASLFEQKVALMMIQKSTPSTGRKGEEIPSDLPEGTTKEEMIALNTLIAEAQAKRNEDTGTRARAHTPTVERQEVASKLLDVGKVE
jgi:hypothetical protein